MQKTVMRPKALLLFLVLFVLAGCDIRQREDALKKKETALNQKEQELKLKEKTLQLKEDELIKREQLLDSIAVVDTTAKFNETLIGTWATKMTCIETTCTGSAVGDTKTESWDVAYEGKYVIVKAKVNAELVRVYSGSFNGSLLELKETRPATERYPATNIIIRLRIVNDSQLEGQREIERNNDCKIIYTVQMDKK